MADQPEVKPLHFTQHLVLVVEGAWPEVTTVTSDLLASPHVYHATYDSETKTLTFDVFNGGAQYRVTDETAPGGARIATLVPESAKRTSRRP